MKCRILFLGKIKIFSWGQDLTFYVQTIYMKCQNLFSGTVKKTFSVSSALKLAQSAKRKISHLIAA